MFDCNASLASLFLVDEIVELGDIRIAVKQETVRGQAVTPGTTDLLIIIFDALGQVEVNDEAYVGLVDAHAKGDGRNDDLRIVADEGILISFSFRIFESCVIWAGRVSP